MDKNTAFIDKAVRIHGDKYKYDKVNYINNTSKVIITCAKHGDFLQAPVKHLRGQNCPKCSGNKKLSTDEFIIRANCVHNDFYDYSKVNYHNIDSKIIIICPEHGEFEQSPYEHLKGHKCYLCGNKMLSLGQFIEIANKKYNNKYDYSKVAYINKKTDVTIICPKHGEFRQKPIDHLKDSNKGGCVRCVIESASNTLDEFIAKSTLYHGYKYNYTNSNYTKSLNSINIICPVHGEFWQIANDHMNGHGCPKCGVIVSNGHQKLLDALPKDIEILCNARDIIKPYEIDIWIPDKKLGIEYHGYYWHGINKFNKHKSNYLKHYQKASAASDVGINLLQIYDFEFDSKPELILSMVNHKLGKSISIYARKCDINYDSNTFCEYNHLQGDRPAAHYISLIYNNEIVACMSLSKHHKYEYEIIRYCCKIGYNVIGGFTKCLAAFCKMHKPKSIFSFSDRRISNGNVYRLNGFRHVGVSKPNYKYCKHNIILSRNKCQKHKLSKLLLNYDDKLSESENMINNGFTQLFDAGNDKWLFER